MSHDSSEPPELPRQPFLHDLVTCVSAPGLALSGRDGQIRPGGAQGFYVADLRVLSELRVAVDEPDGAALAVEAIGHHLDGAGAAEFVAVVRGSALDVIDPTLWLRRRREVGPAGLREVLTLVNVGPAPRPLRLRLALAGDSADLQTVKAGLATPSLVPEIIGGAIVLGSAAARPSAPGRPVRDGASAGIVWEVTVPARDRLSVSLDVSVSDPEAAVVGPRRPVLRRPTVRADDPRLAELVGQSLDDLEGLLAATPESGDDAFLAAGSPWYLTLFGRDSLWAARMLLPVSVDLAGGTLRILAARQGTRVDLETAEEPGKILHEMRRPDAAGDLSPVYYGSIDATPLWICLLADARRWGLPRRQVADLLPALERALDWLQDYGDADGDGFLEYLDRSSRGLANQGWKDSGDSVRFADGRIATGPVALAEVQGYAYQAALEGAALLEAFGRPGADRWRGYAAELKDRFRQSFWCEDEQGRYPALALDGAKVRVDAPASNMGHLLATGILDPHECALVADRLLHPSMASGFGLRTMSDATGGYSPLSYHCGSVWAHDTAIAIEGLLQAGFAAQAAALSGQLLAAGHAFGGRLPELFGGFATAEVGEPLPYPASCRPQAWSAASAVVLLRAVLGLEIDVTAGRLRLRPVTVCGALHVSGLQVAGHPLAVGTDARGGLTTLDYDGPLRTD